MTYTDIHRRQIEAVTYATEKIEAFQHNPNLAEYTQLFQDVRKNLVMLDYFIAEREALSRELYVQMTIADSVVQHIRQSPEEIAYQQKAYNYKSRQVIALIKELHLQP